MHFLKFISKKWYFFIVLTALHLSDTSAQRNVVLIIADDVGTDYFGFYEKYKDTANMPNIRSLLEKGVRFSNATSNPVCSPTRAGILTGQYSFRNGIGDVVVGAGSPTLDTSEMTLPRLLKIHNSNISTANMGKWHLSLEKPTSNLQIPNKVGYDYYAGNFLGAISSYNDWTKITNGVSSTSTNYATTETTDDAINWIKSQQEKPFFLWLAYNAPHTPFHLPPLELHSYKTLSGTTQDINSQPKVYFKAMLEALDHEIGRLFDSLKYYNRYDSTDFVFIGDNGNSIRTAQITNTDRAKGTIYQYGVHVPFIVSGPSIIKPNRTSDALVNTQDLFATVNEILGNLNWQKNIAQNKIIDSKSFLSILQNKSDSVRPWAFTEIFKVVSDSSDGMAIRNKDYKLIQFEYGKQEMYNLSKDHEELNDILLGVLSKEDQENYLYLCNQFSQLIGKRNYCTHNLSNEVLATNTLNIYPNPSRATATIQFTEYQSRLDIEVLNSLGQSMHFFSGKGWEFSISLSQYAKGIYWIRATQNNGTVITSKLIVQ